MLLWTSKLVKSLFINHILIFKVFNKNKKNPNKILTKTEWLDNLIIKPFKY